MQDRSRQWLEEERRALQAEPSDARALDKWLQILVAVRERLEADVPDATLFVLYALERSGRNDLLSEAEREKLVQERASVHAALDRHPSLRSVVEDIESSFDDFDALWSHRMQGWPASEEETSHIVESASDRPPVASSRARTRLVWQIGTGVVAALLITVLIVLMRGDAPVVVTETATDEVVQLELADGTTVRLMGDSRLVHPAAEDFGRRVELYGRAFFEVEPAGTEFVVATPTARTMVRSTRFGIHADEDVTEVVLASGQVVLASDDVAEEVALSPGERSTVSRGQAPTPPETVDLSEELAWTGLMVFRETPSRIIAERLTVVYDVSINVAPALEEESVTGTFDRMQPIEEILQALAATLDAEVLRVNDTFHLVPVED